MTNFESDEALTLEGNMLAISRKARVGDTYNGAWERVDARKNEGTAWVLKDWRGRKGLKK